MRPLHLSIYLSIYLFLDMTLNCIRWWDSISKALWNVENHFVAITPSSTLIIESNRYDIRNFFRFKMIVKIRFYTVYNWIPQLFIWELIFFLIYCGLFVLILVGFFCVVSSFTTFRPNFTSGHLQVIFTATSDRNDESCNRIASNYCLP